MKRRKQPTKKIPAEDTAAADAEEVAQEVKVVAVPNIITVGDLADKIDMPVTGLITILIKSGIMATVNERLDFDTVSLVLGEVGGYEITHETVEEITVEREKRTLDNKAQDRPPVVAVMGHVDHGKTSLLDAIRGANQVDGEAGGITQHISAYQVEHKDRKITFLDTPGHEAFAALREHGATLTDVAIIVVAADDGIKPQTEEAIRFAEKAGVKMVVAINKVDKEGSNINLVKQQLADKKLLVEEYGGDVIAVEVSAIKKTGIDKLLDMVLLVADVEELKADELGSSEGLIIEAHMEKGRGPVATALVEHGQLNTGDFIVAGSTYAKVKTLENSKGEKINDAGPSTPVIITGFKKLPHFGDVFIQVDGEKQARLKAKEIGDSQDGPGRMGDMSGRDLIGMMNKERDTSTLNVIVRADVQGSLTSVRDSLSTLENEEIKVRIIGSGISAINENDIALAATSNAIIYGFNVDIPVNIKQSAARDGVPVRIYKVIYELIDDVKSEMESMLSPEVVETEVGRLIVRGVFMTTKSSIICGGEVTKGKVKPDVLARISRDGEELGEVEVEKVQRQQAEAKEVVEGEMCGLSLKTKSKIDIQEGDKIDFFTREDVARTL